MALIERPFFPVNLRLATRKPAFYAKLFLLLFLPALTLNAQSASFAEEISRLENLARAAPAPRERYTAYMDLARLHRLAGNSEAALKAAGDALAVVPGQGGALLEQARLLMVQGQFEKAASAANALSEKGGAFAPRGRYLAAQIECFSSGNTAALAALAEDSAYAEFRTETYYTLWKVSGHASWKTRLLKEFPQSPEAKIADGFLESAPSPLWLLFPGRQDAVLSARAAPVTPEPAPAAAPSAPGGTPLQAGIFGQEENALALASRLRNAGFAPDITKRVLNGKDHWAVLLSAGRDVNAEIKRLKDAGFDVFPLR